MNIEVKFWESDPGDDWRKDYEKMEMFEYPDKEQFLNLKQNTGYCYVSCTYLNGLVNYADSLYLICSQKYSEDEEFEEIIEKLKNKDWYHTDLSSIEDNTYLISENESSYLLFSYDRDCSDCMIVRFNKEDFTFDQVKDYCLNQAAYESYWYNHENPKYIELPNPHGWIKG